MTTLETTIKRICPEVKSDDGRELLVTLSPTDGGTIVIAWKGKKDSSIDLSLRDLMGYAEGKKPKTKETKNEPGGSKPRIDKREWCRYEDLLSRAHIVAGIEIKERIVLISLIKEMKLYNEWLGVTSGISWENFKNKVTAEGEEK